jgi:hypothetical protein
MKNRLHGLTSAGFVIASVAVIATGCGAVPNLPGNIPGAGALPSVPKCPDLATVESALAFDYAKEFSIQADGAAKLRAGVAASVEMTGLNAKVDGDLKVACSGIVTDLGGKADFKTGTDACNAAAAAIADVKAKLGATLRVSLNVQPPVCRADINAMADCSAKCEVNATPGSVKVECEPGKASGQCDAQCKGTCDMTAAAACNGECRGTCDAEIKGSCSGTCNGKCDGKAGNGACGGLCEGKCEGGQVQATCKGKCGGTCNISGEAKCEGTCNGGCTVDFKAPKCTGEVQAPKVSAECKAQCDTKLTAKAECTPAKVGVAISGGADAKLVGTLKATMEKNLPAILRISIGMKDNLLRVKANGSAAVDGVRASISEVSKQAGAKAALVGGQITACVGGTFKAAGSAAASLEANVQVSVKVQASATASASGSGSAAGGAKTAE